MQKLLREKKRRKEMKRESLQMRKRVDPLARLSQLFPLPQQRGRRRHRGEAALLSPTRAMQQQKELMRGRGERRMLAT